jgi:hypothetical protein
MTLSVQIVYRDFFDVPRLFAFRLRESWFVCDCPFEPSLDDYPTEYEVYRLAGYDGADPTAEWPKLKPVSEFAGRVPVGAVIFDPTRRHSADVGAIAATLDSRAANPGGR